MHERLFENLKTWTPTPDETDGKYGIPKLEPCELPEIARWVPFNDLSRKTDKTEGIQMYVDDYRIGRIWQSPLRYIDGLRRAGAVLTPDYSIYTDVPAALGIYNHYRKHWLGAYWQQCGLTVIPTICWGVKRHLNGALTENRETRRSACRALARSAEPTQNPPLCAAMTPCWSG